VSGLTDGVARASVGDGVGFGCVESELLDEAAVVEPVCARSREGLGVSALHEASARTVAANSPNRMVLELSAEIASPTMRTSATLGGGS
jgi:hypothetical protein